MNACVVEVHWADCVWHDDMQTAAQVHLLWNVVVEMSRQESPFSAVCSGGLRIMNSRVCLDEEFVMNGACKGAV